MLLLQVSAVTTEVELASERNCHSQEIPLALNEAGANLMIKVTTTAAIQNEICQTWTEAGTNLQLNICSEAVDQIKSEIIRGMKAIPKRGAEVGGIFFGSIRKQGLNCTVEIEHIFAVPVEYRFGPSYRFSEVDEKAFSRALHAWPERQAIGWYRSNTRPATEPTPDDDAITAENFPTSNLFLLLRPDFTGSISARFQISGYPAHEFAFGRFSFLDQLLNGTDDDQEGNNTLAVFDTQGREHSVAIPAPHHVALPEAPRTAWRATIPLVIAASAIGGGIAAWTLLRPQPVQQHATLPPVILPAAAKTEPLPAAPIASTPTAAATPTLGLSAEFQQNSLMVHWDRQSPSILQASTAAFTLQQGQQHRTIALDVATLRSGSLMIRPNSADLDLRLDVHTAQGDVSQSLRVIGFRDASPQIQTARPTIAKATPAVVQPSAIQPPAIQTSAQQPSAVPSKGVASASTTAPPFSIPNTPLRKTEQTRTATLEEPPQVAASHPDSALPHMLNNIPASRIEPQSTARAPLGNPPQTAAAPSVKPVAPAPVPPIQIQPTPTASISNESLTPPKAIRKVQAEAPANARSIIAQNGYADASSGQVVGVEVLIDESGKVIKAHVVNESGPFVRLFEQNAIAAAKQWSFEPAKSGSKPIASRTVLTFRFAATPR